MVETVVISGGLYFPPGTVVGRILADTLKKTNPEWIQANRMRETKPWIPLPERHVRACHAFERGHPWAGGIAAPRSAQVDQSGIRFVDKRTFPPAESLSLSPDTVLRDYQASAVAKLVEAEQGLVIAPCGAGKTTIGIGAMAALDTKALVLVHTRDLAVQWIDRCKSQLGVEATLVGAGKSDDSGRVVVATFQTIEKMDWNKRFAWAKSFGLVIVDEAHHVPASTFNRVLLSMPARYRLGLTATPKRNDGLTDFLYWHFGAVLESIETNDLAKKGHVVTPRVEWMNTDWEGPSKKLEWPLFINRMTKDGDRNFQILQRVEQAVNDGRQILVLSDRVQHCEEMAVALRQRGIKAQALVGKLTKKARAAIIESTQSGETRVLTATTIADEGLDLPTLDTVVLCTPTKAMGRVQQRVGRIMRPSSNKKEPLIIDVVDLPRPLRGLANKRMKLYIKLGCTW